LWFDQKRITNPNKRNDDRQAGGVRQLTSQTESLLGSRRFNAHQNQHSMVYESGC
jgi:hypothetical protein